jgi:hypothetical protein
VGPIAELNVAAKCLLLSLHLVGSNYIQTQWFQFAKRTTPTERPPLVGEVRDRLCGLVVRVPGYRSRGPALPDFLRSSGSGTEFTQPREDN